MYLKDHKQFSVVWTIPNDVASSAFDELKGVFNEKAKVFLGENVDTIIKKYSRTASNKCRFTVLFPKIVEDPDNMEHIITDIIRLAVMEVDVLCVNRIRENLLEKVLDSCEKYFKN